MKLVYVDLRLAKELKESERNNVQSIAKSKRKKKNNKKIIVYVGFNGAVVSITRSEAPNWLNKTNTCKFDVAPLHIISLNESHKIYNINTSLTLSGITI